MTDRVIIGEVAASPLSINAEVDAFHRLRERAHEQIAALAVTVAALEKLRTEIERHRQPHAAAV